jgi:hypothetical protein
MHPTQTVALSALLFLYRQVLQIDLPDINDIERAKKPERLPVVFSRSEVKPIAPPHPTAATRANPAVRIPLDIAGPTVAL